MEVALLIVGTLVAVIAAIGWLYWLRTIVSNWPGPKLSQALPLDALSSRDSVPLVVFVVLFGGVGTLIGTGLRRSHIRTTPGVLGLAAVVWVVLYVANTISLFTVRQIPFLDALHQALQLAPTYLATAIAGICGVIAARSAVGRALARRRTGSGVDLHDLPRQ